MVKYEAQELKEIDSQTVAEAISRMAGTYRDPFVSIIGYSEALLEGISGELSAAQRADVEAILASGWQALGQLNDILDVMNLLAGELELELSTIRLQRLLDDVVRDVGRSRSKEQWALKTKIADNLPMVSADEPRLRQTLLGLIDAALRDTPSGTNVWLIAEAQADSVCLSVQDGCQVASEDDLTYFFEPSWLSRLKDNHWRRMHWQSFLAHYLVAKTGGRIWVEAVEAEGEMPAGTRVSMTIPLAKEDTAKEQIGPLVETKIQ